MEKKMYNQKVENYFLFSRHTEDLSPRYNLSDISKELSQRDKGRERIGYPLQYSWASFVAQMVKNLPTMQESHVQSLGQEDPLEEGMATNMLAWIIPWAEEPGGL